MQRLGVTIPSEDRDLIERALRFANLETLPSQKAAYDIFLSHPYVSQRAPFFQVIPEAEGTMPFVRDQERARDVLKKIAAGRGVEEVKRERARVLGEKLHGFLRVSWRRGRLELVAEPFLDGVEAAIWYAVALLFHHRLTRRLKTCRASLGWRECGKFFLWRPGLRNYCSKKHAELGKRQKAADRQRRYRHKLVVRERHSASPRERAAFERFLEFMKLQRKAAPTEEELNSIRPILKRLGGGDMLKARRIVAQWEKAYPGEPERVWSIMLSDEQKEYFSPERRP